MKFNYYWIRSGSILNDENNEQNKIVRSGNDDKIVCIQLLDKFINLKDYGWVNELEYKEKEKMIRSNDDYDRAMEMII